MNKGIDRRSQTTYHCLTYGTSIKNSQFFPPEFLGVSYPINCCACLTIRCTCRFFLRKLIFGLFCLCGVTICFHWVSLNLVVSGSFDISICWLLLNVRGKTCFFSVKTENIQFYQCISCAISCMTALCCLFCNNFIRSKLNQLLIVVPL